MKRVDGPKPSSFVPFTLAIESEDEAKLLAGLLGATTNTVSRALGVDNTRVAYDMYTLIEEYNVNPNSITIKT